MRRAFFSSYRMEADCVEVIGAQPGGRKRSVSAYKFGGFGGVQWSLIDEGGPTGASEEYRRACLRIGTARAFRNRTGSFVRTVEKSARAQ